MWSTTAHYHIILALMMALSSSCLIHVTTAGPVRVFVLAGQSNMEGPGSMVHLRELLSNSTTSSEYQHLWSGTNNNWALRDDVFIKFHTNHSNLTTGYGFGPDRFGPELEFGWTVGDALDDNVMIIKTAWGGQPLAVTFRPPSSGIGNYTYCNPKTKNCIVIPPTYYGKYYRAMVEDVYDTLANLEQYVPGYNQSDGYILSGLVWFQGWQDHLDWTMIGEYKKNLINLIHDVRLDLHAPNLPFIIGELGQGGIDPVPPDRDGILAIRKIEEEVASLQQYQNNTRFIKTSTYVVNGAEIFDGSLHYFGRADTFCHIGKAFGKAMLDLIHDEIPRTNIFMPTEGFISQQ